MSVLNAALWLAARGFAVFPADHPGLERCAGVGRNHDPSTCQDRGKHPAVAFTRTHSTDPEQLSRWFGGEPRNIGVAVGVCRGRDGTRLLVVDSDRPGALEDAAAAHGHRHTPTMRVTTAKGHHDYYWAPASMRLGNGLGALRGKFDGDVRAGNAYVIAAGSVHATGVLYELDDPERPPASAPGWLLTALQSPPERPPVAASPCGSRAGGRLLGLVRFVLQSQAGERNNRLYWAARRAFEQQAGPDANVASALLEAAVQAGLTEGEARQTITSAYRSRAAR